MIRPPFGLALGRGQPYFATEKRHEVRYPSFLRDHQGGLRLRQYLRDSLDHGRGAPRRNLLRLPSLLHGPAEDR